MAPDADSDLSKNSFFPSSAVGLIAAVACGFTAAFSELSPPSLQAPSSTPAAIAVNRNAGDASEERLFIRTKEKAQRPIQQGHMRSSRRRSEDLHFCHGHDMRMTDA
ncbi:hypothetical protein [Comamonas fluminis]|uniref:hypothetical protein n=1 Tax=Comamonas fluminis TaxID=2796366 RepID=UPI001FE8C2C2|nr:hypothetical protein [Comamonas fluminis]